MNRKEYVCVNIKDEPANSDDQLNLKSVVNKEHDINAKEESAEYIYHNIFVKDENMELENSDDDDGMDWMLSSGESESSCAELDFESNSSENFVYTDESESDLSSNMSSCKSDVSENLVSSDETRYDSSFEKASSTDSDESPENDTDIDDVSQTCTDTRNPMSKWVPNETSKDFLANDDDETSENGGFKLNETFYCPLCTYTSTKKAYLKKHSVVHLNDKIFRCPQCNYGCNRKWDFRIHLLTHTKAKLLTCCNCDYACNTRRQLNVHKLKHLDTKLFKCSDCEYQCNRKWDLNRHLLKHMETKLFRCGECEYACNRKEKLSQHLLTHSSIKLFKCLKCEYACNQKGNLSRHYVLKHTPKKS